MKINSVTKENLTFIEITNDVNLTIVLCNLGASIHHVILEGKYLTRNAKDICDFKKEECYHGKTIGRVANRIKGHEIEIDNQKYLLENNEGENVLHGGHNGLSNQIFDYKINNNNDYISVIFSHVSKEGESGFPGKAEITIKYLIFLKNQRFDVIFEAKADKDTPISLTNHTYFTLGTILDKLELKITSDKYLDVDEEMIAKAVKEVTPVMDFRKYKPIINDIDSLEINRDRLRGYDHFYFYNNKGIANHNLSLKSDDLIMDVYSDFEGVQIYTSNFANSYALFPDCDVVRDSIAIEPSDNHLQLHMLKKGEVYKRYAIYNFRKPNMETNPIKINFKDKFGSLPEHIFSCGGRFEILGNHTDHNHGLCLAATCNLCITAGVSRSDDNFVRFSSKGYEPDVLSLGTLTPVEEEKGRSKALIRGVAAYLVEHGYKVGGFSGYSESTIFAGAGVSSSAAFELLIGQIFNELFNAGKISKLELAKAGQYAENVYFGKASGLLDQIGVAYGNIAFIDFEDIKNPIVEDIVFPFKDLHFVIINTGGSHAALSHLYSAIPNDMYNAAKKAGVSFLRETSLNRLPKEGLSEIEASRALHFYTENERVKNAVEAIKNKDEATFLRMINESRVSSTNNLKNMMVEDNYVGSPLEACDLFMKATNGEGAIKINGGGFAGSVIAVINSKLLPTVLKEMGKKYGENNVVEVFVRRQGPCKH